MDYIVYLDMLQRLLMAEKLEETESAIQIKNPLILHVTTTNGQLNIQFFPVMFREFQADKDAGSTVTIQKANISIFDKMVLEGRLIAQYQRIFSPLKDMPPVNMGGTPMPQQMPQQNPNPTVIKLFPEEDEKK